MSFQPIAIVGHACVFPGALNPEDFWQIVLNKKNVITNAAEGSWEADIDSFLPESTQHSVIPADKCWHSFGGYVRDFEKFFDPSAYGLDSNLISELDPLFQWILYAGKESFAQSYTSNKRVGTIIGNLSYPTRSMNKLAQSIWCDSLDIKPVNPQNRFMSGYPAALLAQSLNLSGPSYCIDAACASSLYAIKLACDELHQGNVDMMLAGGVNAVDDLVLHVGFSALGALSKSGKSRPFHKDADGIVTSTGAAFVSLKRLEDARADGDNILALITGMGFSNDGIKGGLLGPSVNGQIQAMQAAYKSAGVSPDTVSLIECHATGTAVGDNVELESLEAIYSGCSEVPIGSVKSNLGHLITAAGMAGVMKVTLAMKAGIRPPTIGADSPLSRIKDSPFRLLTEAEPWNVQGPRRAAVSSFGFGGNNAHIILEEYQQQSIGHKPKPKKLTDLAIVGIGLRVANLKSSDAVSIAWLHSDSQLKTNNQGNKEAKTETIELDYLQTRVSPNDLDQIHAQQLIVIAATNEAVKSTDSDLDNERTSVFMGMAANADASRCFARLQVAQASGVSNISWQKAAKDAIFSEINDVITLGSMPNIVANRINVQYDFKGPSLTFSAEELSGIEALYAARSALSNNEIDAAIVGAVDLCCEAVQTQVATECLPKNKHCPGDAAVSLVVKRLTDAQNDNDTIYAVISNEQNDHNDQDLSISGDDVTKIFGHSHAASGLLQVAVAALSIHHNAVPATGELIPKGVRNKNLNVRVNLESFTGIKRSLFLKRCRSQVPASLLSGLAPILCTFAGETRQDVITDLENNRQSTLGKSRLAIIANSPSDCENKKMHTLKLLKDDLKHMDNVLLPGVYFSDEPLSGEIAFTFPSSAWTYTSMGQDILLAYPELLEKVRKKVTNWTSIKDPMRIVYADDSDISDVSFISKLEANFFLSLVSAIFSQEILGLKPTSFIGFSAGEIVAFFISGVWNDVEQFHRQLVDNGVYSKHIAGEFKILDKAWKDYPNVKRCWATWGVIAPYTAVTKALATESLVYLATINYKDNFTICGQMDACQRVVALIGTNNCLPLDYNVIQHCPEVEHYKNQWLVLNTRKIHRTDVRFYGANDPDTAFYPDQKSIREANLGMALKTVDYPKVIESAYRDGVRIFVEHGPNCFCSSNINQILSGRAHLAVSLDGPGKHGIQQIFESCAQLFVAGVDYNFDALTGGSNNTINNSTRTSIKTFPGHEREIVLPDMYTPLEEEPKADSSELDNQVQVMQKAPELLKVLPFKRNRSNHRTGKPESEYGSLSAVRSLSSDKPNAVNAKLSIENAIEVHRDFIRRSVNSHNKYLELNRKFLNVIPTTNNCLQHDSMPCAGAGMPASTTTASFSTEQTLSSDEQTCRENSDTASTTEKGTDSSGGHVIGDASLWCEGVKFYEAKNIGMRIVDSTAQTVLINREKLEGHAIGEFSGLVKVNPNIRLPAPPFLFIDRITEINLATDSREETYVKSEWDLKANEWYLHKERLDSGLLLLESIGQASTFLCSILDADNRHTNRVLRILSLDNMRFYSQLPKVGDSLYYKLTLKRQFSYGKMTSYFFKYQCWNAANDLLAEVENALTALLPKAELLNAKGVSWSAENFTPDANALISKSIVTSKSFSFSRDKIHAFAEGNGFDCFGPGFEALKTHKDTPRLSTGKVLQIDEVSDFNSSGGPWKRGYLKAIKHIDPNEWFFTAHFTNDPCMPAALIGSGCIQCLCFYLAAGGFTIDKDGYHFEPYTDMECRYQGGGQVTPENSNINYEIFVEELAGGEETFITAYLRVTVDQGLAIFFGRLGIRLVPN